MTIEEKCNYIKEFVPSVWSGVVSKDIELLQTIRNNFAPLMDSRY